MKHFHILLVEDNRADALFVEEAFKQSNVNIHLDMVEDGDQALDYLNRLGKYEHQTAPDLVLLDLNLPRVDGHTVLNRIKTNPALKRTPVMVLTSSTADIDVKKSYDNHANAYVVKPVGLAAMMKTVTAIENFWVDTVKSAPKNDLAL